MATPFDSVLCAGLTSSNAPLVESLVACFQDSACQKAEIFWALKHVYNGLSYYSLKHVVDLFKTVFK